jgi:hypothetical protein
MTIHSISLKSEVLKGLEVNASFESDEEEENTIYIESAIASVNGKPFDLASILSEENFYSFETEVKQCWLNKLENESAERGDYYYNLKRDRD